MFVNPPVFIINALLWTSIHKEANWISLYPKVSENKFLRNVSNIYQITRCRKPRRNFLCCVKLSHRLLKIPTPKPNVSRYLFFSHLSLNLLQPTPDC